MSRLLKKMALWGALSLSSLSAIQAAAAPDSGDKNQPALSDGRYIGVWGAPVLPGWTRRIGLQGMLLPAYEGAKNYIFWPLPSLEVDYDDKLYLNTTACTYAIFQNKWISVGPEATPFLGRKESYSPALRGMGDLPFDLKGGAFLGLHSPVGSLLVEGSRSLTSSVGSTGSISFQSGYLFDVNHFILNVAPGVTWADRSYMRNNFGITPGQSTTSGYPVYLPSSGFYNYWINVAPTFIIGTRQYVIPSFAYVRLFGDAKQSPLVAGPGTRNQFVTQLSYQYLF